MENIVIAGGGISGFTTAFEAISKGYNVILLEKSSEVASGTSKAHVGILSLYAAQGLDAKSFFSPIEEGGYITPGFLVNDATRQWMSGLNSHHEALLKTRIKLARFSEAIRVEQANHPAFVAGEYHFREDGLQKLYFLPGFAEIDKKSLQRHAIPFMHINSHMVFTDALEALTIPGGSMNPAEFTKAMKKSLEETGKFLCLQGEEAVDFHKDQGKITGIQTNTQLHKADYFILATGPDTELIRTINPAIADKILPFTGVSKTVSIPTEPMTSILAPLQLIFPNEEGKKQMVNVSVFLRDGKAEIRFAGLYAAGKVQKEKLDYFEKQLDKAITLVLGDMREKDYEISDMWTGYRPMTATGLPILGQDPTYANLIYNIGHGSSGTSLATGSARIAVAAIKKEHIHDYRGKHTKSPWEAFSPSSAVRGNTL